jgi:septal ring factor EnvC (AmiA/AmiB activator)
MGKIGGKKKKKSGKGGKQEASPRGGAAVDSGVPSKKATSGFSGGHGFTEQDVEFMKKAIQMLCQSTNPLGKSIDFVTDDVDSMSKEYEKWRKESISCTSGLEDQIKITEEATAPLNNQLAELEEKIREQQNKIAAAKALVMRNDITIQNLLYSMI